MSKQIRPSELAEVVTGLLVRPDLLGEIDTSDQHERFIEAIGEVVADFCGGTINGVNPSDSQNPASDYVFTAYLSVYPNDSLSSLENCVWAPYDASGWEGLSNEDYGLESPDNPPTRQEMALTRARLRSLLIEAYGAEIASSL